MEPNERVPDRVTPEVRRAVLETLEAHTEIGLSQGLSLPMINQRIPYGYTRIELTLEHLEESGRIKRIDSEGNPYPLFVLNDNMLKDQTPTTTTDQT